MSFTRVAICSAAFSLLISPLGCRSHQPLPASEQSKQQPPAASDSKQPELKALLSSTDELALVEKYTEQVYMDPIGAKIGPGVIGSIMIQPIIVTDIEKNKKSKGAHVFLFDLRVRPGRHRDYILDEDELHDLSNALNYDEQEAMKWVNDRPDHDSRIIFQTKDGLAVSLEPGQPQTGPEMFFSSSVSDSSEPVVHVAIPRIVELTAYLSVVFGELKSH